MKTLPIPPPGWKSPEMPTIGVRTLSDALQPDIECLDRRSVRKCVKCGSTFDAVGLTAFCDPCGIEVDEQASLPPVRKLDSSWPKLHAEKLADLHGPALDMAEKLAPKLFGNRLCVLAGDRGRGKTQIATFIAYYRLTKGHDCGIYSRAGDMTRLCSGFDSDARKALLAFQKVPFLVIDEAHRIDPRRIEILETVLDARYSNKRPTMILGNWMTEAGMLAGEIVSSEKLHGLGPTIMDRINEHTTRRTGGVVWCRWASYRQSAGTAD